MIYYTPIFQSVPKGGDQTVFIEKYGGLPWGIPEKEWPNCVECGATMSHVAALKHDSERLNLGKDGRIVLIFMCEENPGMCETWDANSGANAVVFLEESQLRPKITLPPTSDTVVLPEARVLAWEQKEDGVKEEDYPRYFNNRDYFALGEAEDGEDEDDEGGDTMSPNSGFKLGSIPCWVQGAEEGPKEPFRFVAQLSPIVEISGADQLEVATYGDYGLAYLFVLPDAEKPEGAFFWQC
jgi:hypothetical protein